MRASVDEAPETVSSTVRFNGDLKRFLDAQASAWGGVSTQSVITTILTAVMHETLKPTAADRIDIIPARILTLFDLHGIDRITAAEILGVPFVDMKPERLINHVSNAVIDRLAEDFSINRSWLLGDEDRPGKKVFDWYKTPTAAAQRILKLARLRLKPKIYFIKGDGWDLGKSKAADKTTQSDNIAIVIELTRKVNPSDPYSREYMTYELWQDAPWDYQKSRIDVLSLILFCRNMEDDRSRRIAEKMGQDANYFLEWGETFSWDDLNIPSEAFDALRHFSILPSQIMQSHAISRQKSGVPVVRSGGWASLDDYVDSKEDSAVSKRDEEEFKYVLEHYNKMIENIAKERHFERKQRAEEFVEG